MWSFAHSQPTECEDAIVIAQRLSTQQYYGLKLSSDIQSSFRVPHTLHALRGAVGANERLVRECSRRADRTSRSRIFSSSKPAPPRAVFSSATDARKAMKWPSIPLHFWRLPSMYGFNNGDRTPGRPSASHMRGAQARRNRHLRRSTNPRSPFHDQAFRYPARHPQRRFPAD